MKATSFNTLVSSRYLLLLLVISAICVPRAARCQAMVLELESPDWTMLVDEYGYSDLALDKRPEYEGREYLSGEWAAAVAYSDGANRVGPVWLNPDFLFPDWKSNSDFGVESSEFSGTTNSYGLKSWRSVITNGFLRISITSEMVDTTNGIAQGVAPRRSTQGTNTLSDRYVFRQSFEIANRSGRPLSDIRFFKFLHALESSSAVYDDREYGATFNGHRYTISQQGLDMGWVGSSYLRAVHADTVALHANLPPKAWEVGRYGVEDIDDHVDGKPSVGVHWSVEADDLSGLDSFAPTNKWVSGAMRFDLGTLAANGTTNLEFLMSLRTDTAAQTCKVVAWGDNSYGQTNVPAGLTNVVKVAAGNNHCLALCSGGTVVAWGDNSFGQANVPAGLKGVVDIAAGGTHSLARLNDGRVVAWGNNASGQCTVPAEVTNAMRIAAGENHSLARLSYDQIIAWGHNAYGQTDVPGPFSFVEEIAAGGNHSLAVLFDGTVIGWGDNSFGQISIPDNAKDVYSIAAGANHSVVALYDGTVVVWGDGSFGQTEVPVDLEYADTVVAGGNHSFALDYLGNVVGWGADSYGQASIPRGIGKVLGIGAGAKHSVALVPVAPRLSLAISEQNGVLAWSGAWSPELEDVVLERATSIENGDWTIVPILGFAEGAEYKMKVPMSGAACFYRLRIQ